MKAIIDPVPVELIKAELTKSKKLEDTNRGHNELYIVTWQDSPNVVTEIGRLREVTFRDAGGSTGNEIDLDEYDKMENPYKQLVVWDPDNEAIVGGYRFFYGTDAKFDEKGQPIMASSHQFRFSQKFIDEYLPYVLEVGRNFVVPEYQSSKSGAKSIYAMDNLWDGMVEESRSALFLRQDNHVSIIRLYRKGFDLPFPLEAFWRQGGTCTSMGRFVGNAKIRS